MGDLPEGVATTEMPLASNSKEPNQSEIPNENWVLAEKEALEIIRKVQPTSASEERRKDVVDYIQRLIRNYLGAEVFPYGSVPLKTYLPDGDIDLTAFGGLNAEDTLADEIKSILEEEGKNMRAEFVVKDVQLIRAEVKLVKCIVENIIVDVSVNQLGGLSTLCFLEEVDRLIGKDHLFKYSIILIKAWCYYESHILGAHHGLISTYALETLVLYIFHRFHSSLDGPLAVLHKFLDYFSNFDWENYCISLNGPVRLSSFPAIVAEMPEDSGDLLLTSDFLTLCVAKFSVPPRGGDNSRSFQLKHLNIVDPLKETNNLGRSVSQANFYRIRIALSYGARKLGDMLLQPRDSIADELHKFFSNTMTRHGGAERPDVPKIDNLYDVYPTGVFRSDINKMAHDLFKGPEKAFDADLATSVLGGLTIGGDELIDKDEKMDPNKQKDFSGSLKSPLVSGDENSLSDLTGDYESHLQCLQYGRLCYDFALDMQSLHMPAPSPYRKWDSQQPMSRFKQNGFSHRHHNGFHPNPAMFAMHHALMPGVPFGFEDVTKPRGTGTYFPNMGKIETPQGYRSSAVKGSNHTPTRSPHNNERNLMIGSSDGYPTFSPRGVIELELEKSRQPKPVLVSPKILSGMQKSKPALSKEQDR